MKKGISIKILQAALTGFFCGLIVIAFRYSIEHLFSFIKLHFYSMPLIFIFITTLGGLISGFLVYKFAPETSGSGIPYVKIALMKSGALIRIRTVFIKFFAGVAGIGTGLSLGREGPSVQLGAGVGSLIGKLFNLSGNNKANLIASGAGAAISATFNAPVAGTLFVLEELTHNFSPVLLFMCLIASVISSSVGRYFMGVNPAFNVHLAPIGISKEILLICIITGVLSGFFGVLFTKTIFLFNKIYSSLNIPNYYKPALAGLITGVTGLFLPYILSSGNNTVEMLLNYKFSIFFVLVIFVVKFFITPVCFSSGAAGGIFLPMLTTGAFLGYLTGYAANILGFDINLIAASSLGMAGFLSAVARTPLTAIVMVFEMTGGYECILPLMLTVAMAEFTAEKFNQRPIYSKLAVNQYKNMKLNISKTLLVKNVMKKSRVFCNDTPLTEILNIITTEGHSTYPVADMEGKLLGTVKKDDIKDILTDSNRNYVTADKILETSPVIVNENDDLYIAFFRLHEASENCAVVIDDDKNISGVVTRADILNQG